MIVIPNAIWNQMFVHFRRTRKKLEQVCYLDGFKTGTLSVVTTLTIPNAELHPGYFTVTSKAMDEAGEHLFEHGLRRIAQVHTHPTDWVGHSPYDDAHAYSQAVGSISIVLPQYAKREAALQSCGVLIKEPHQWRELSVAEKLQTVRFIPSHLDFRRKK